MKRLSAAIVLGCISLCLLGHMGCASFFSTLMYAVGADLQPAEFDGLKDQRVAVVVVTDGSQYRDDIASTILQREVSEKLEVEVGGIELVREEEIDSWTDANQWDQIDFVSIGKGVKSSKVLAIEVTGLRLREGQTLYRGRADVTTTVYDVKTGKREFRRHLEDFTFPVHTGKYASETTESRFRRNFLIVLGSRVARYFHRYDPKDAFALDAAIVNL